MELDNAYAFILYHKKGKITAKLYGGSLSYATATLSVLYKGWVILNSWNHTHTDSWLCLIGQTGRSTVNLSEPMLTKFETLAQEKGMSLAYLFPFPTFGKSTSSLGKQNRNFLSANKFPVD